MIDRALKGLLLASLIVVLAACSRVQFFYNQLDWLVPFYLNTYIALDERQYAFLEQEVASLLEWHCGAHLRNYARLLREANADFQQRRMTPARLRAYTDRMEYYWFEILRQALPAIAELMHTASDEQVDELFAVFRERNEEARERFAESNREELLESYQERMTEELERWFGSLTPEQESFVVAWSGAFRPLGEEGLAFRIDWQDRLRALLAARGNKTALKAGLEELLLQTHTLRSPDYQTRLEQNAQVTIDMVARVGQTLTPAQFKHLQQTVEEFAKDFEALACEAEEKSVLDPPAENKGDSP